MLGQIFTIIFDIFVILLGVFLVSKFQIWFAKHRLMIITVCMVLGIIIYTVGYLAKNPVDYITSGLMAIFSTGRMFVLENDISSFETNVAGNNLYNIAFGFIMAFSMLVTAMIVLSFFGYRIISKIQLVFLHFTAGKRPVYLFTDLNEKGQYLAEDIKKGNKKCIIIDCVDGNREEEVDKALELKTSKLGALILTIYDKDDIYQICKKFKNNKIVFFANGDDDYDNVSKVHDFVELLKSETQPRMEVSFYTFLRNCEYEDVFRNELYTGQDIHIIDETDMVSRQLFRDFTLISSIKDTNVLTVCVIGYSEISDNLYRNISYLGQNDGITLRMILMDEEIEDKTALFFHKNPEIIKCVEFYPVNAKINSKEYYEYLNKEIGNIDCIIIAEDNIDTVTEIGRICRWNSVAPKICAYVKDYEKCKYLYETSLLHNITCFGSIKDIFTESIIVNEALDELAKQCHKYYCEVYGDTRKWEAISMFEKQSNRALALHFQSKLYTLGLVYVKDGDTGIYDKLIKNQDIFEKLSKSEHLRWNAYHFANGWRTMEDYQNHEKNKDGLLRLHSCLVVWDKLDVVGDSFKKDYKKADRHLIQNVGNILSAVGYGIKRIE